MMSNEIFAMLTAMAIFLAIAGAGWLLWRDIVRRHPAKTKRNERIVTDERFPLEGLIDEERLTSDRVAERVRENADLTAHIVREANKLAVQIDGFTRALTGSK